MCMVCRIRTVFLAILVIVLTLGNCDTVARSQTYPLNNTYEAPLAASAYAKALGVATHFDRVSSGVYAESSTDATLGAYSQLVKYMWQLPVDHYRSRFTDDPVLAAHISDIASTFTANGLPSPKADFIVDLRRNCTAPPSDHPTTTYTSITAAPNPPALSGGNQSTTFTVTICSVDLGNAPALSGRVTLQSNSGPIDSGNFHVVNSDGQIGIALTMPSFPANITATFTSDSPTSYQNSSSLPYTLLTSVPPATNCPAVPAVGGGPIEVGSTLYPNRDLLYNSSVVSRDASHALDSLFTAMSATGVKPSVGYIEAPNEYDNNHNDRASGDTVWPTYLSNFDSLIATKISSTSSPLHGIPRIAPSMGNYIDAQNSGPLHCSTSSCYDFGNTHAYPNQTPSANMLTGIGTAQSIAGVSAPIFQTESGYHTAQDYQGPGFKGIGTVAAAMYGPRTIAEYLLTQLYRSGIAGPGITAMNFYQLVDNDAGSNCNADKQANDGLLKVIPGSGSTFAVVSPKPIYTSLQSTLAFLKDTGSAPALNQIGYYFSNGNDNDLHHLLMLKSDGSYDLLLWKEVDIWNFGTPGTPGNPGTPGSVKVIPPAQVIVAKPTWTHATSYVPRTDTTSVLNPQSDGSFSVRVAGELVIVKLN